MMVQPLTEPDACDDNWKKYCDVLERVQREGSRNDIGCCEDNAENEPYGSECASESGLRQIQPAQGVNQQRASGGINAVDQPCASNINI